MIHDLNIWGFQSSNWQVVQVFLTEEYFLYVSWRWKFRQKNSLRPTWKASWRFLFEPPRVLCERGTVEHSSCCKRLAVRQCCMKFSRETCYSGNVATWSTMTIRKGFVLRLRVRQQGSSHVQRVHLHLPDLNEQASQKTHACPASLEYCTNIAAFIWQYVHVINILNKPFWGPW